MCIIIFGNFFPPSYLITFALWVNTLEISLLTKHEFCLIFPHLWKLFRRIISKLFQLDVVYDKEGFVHFYQGPQFEPLPTHATFLIDLSPSMSDDKLQLAKQALTILMQSLNRSDFFNIVLFNRPSESLPVHWSPLETSSQENQTISVEPETVEAAVNFISGLAASNASIVNNDLNEALNHSCKLGQGLPDNVARRLVLLTDGAHVGTPDLRPAPVAGG